MTRAEELNESVSGKGSLCVWLGGRRFWAVVASIAANARFPLLREHLGFRCCTLSAQIYGRALYDGPVVVIGDYFSLDAYQSDGETVGGFGER